jgi:hypothetical protein
MNTKYYLKLLSRNDLGYRTTDPDGQPSNTQYILLHQGAFGGFFPNIIKEAIFDFNIFHKTETMQITIKSSPKVSHLALKKKFADVGVFEPNDIIVFEKMSEGKYSITKISPKETVQYSKYLELSNGGHFTNNL